MPRSRSVHANFIVNRGQATAAEIIALIRRVRARVQQARGITLEPEVLLYGREWKDVSVNLLEIGAGCAKKEWRAGLKPAGGVGLGFALDSENRWLPPLSLVARFRWLFAPAFFR